MRTLLSGLVVAALAGCGSEDDGVGTSEAAFLTEAEKSAIVAFVNQASFVVLDDEVGLDRRAAENIVAHRDGLDGLASTGDDDLFDDMVELDAIAYVGPAALEKLRAWVESQGLVEGGAPSCLVISEYIEGWGNYNKAIELFNCGTEPVDTGSLGLCMVRNDDTSCTLNAALPEGSLEPGAVLTVCRNALGTVNDPMPWIRDACEVERPGVMTFNGDDRLAVFHDADGDGELGSGELLDMLGRFGYQPPVTTWQDLTLRRCNLTPSDGVSYYDHADYFTEHTWGSQQHYGLPPEPGGCP